MPSSQIPFFRLACTALAVSPEMLQYFCNLTHFIVPFAPDCMVPCCLAFARTVSAILEQGLNKVRFESTPLWSMFPA